MNRRTIIAACRILLGVAVAGPAAMSMAQQPAVDPDESVRPVHRWATAQATERARDLDPATAAARKAIRRAQGPLTFHGSLGFLDYSEPLPVSMEPERLRWLVGLIPGGEEPEEVLPLSYSRGQRVEIDWEFLDGLQDGVPARAMLPLLDGEELELVFLVSEYRGPQNYTWFGQIAGVAASDFILVRYHDAVRLVVRDYQDKLNYSVDCTPGSDDLPVGHALRKVGDIRPPVVCGTCSNGDCGNAGPDDQADNGPEHPFQPGSVPHPHGDPADGSRRDPGYGPRSAQDPSNIIDVMFLPTGYLRNNGFNSNWSVFQTAVQVMVDDFHLRSQNSGAGLLVRVVSMDWDLLQAYTQETADHSDINSLGTFQSGESQYWPAAREAAFDRSADVAVLVRALNYITQTPSGGFEFSSGAAYRPKNDTELRTHSGARRVAVCIGQVPQSKWGYIFSHELVHTLGACHSTTQTVNRGCHDALGSSITPSPHGLEIGNVVDGCGTCGAVWYTTMAYERNLCNNTVSSAGLPYFSNPSLSLHFVGCGTRPLGNSEANVTGLINHSRPIATQRRIQSARLWANPYASTGSGTHMFPFPRVAQAVQFVQGGTAQAVVRAVGYGNVQPYNETAANGGPVTLSNPCVIETAGPGHVVIR
jgi:hypothetical protein